MSSGVQVSDECVTKYNGLKLGHESRYILFRLSDDLREVVVDKVAPKDAPYSDFLDSLPANDCRYAVYDFDFTAEDGGQRNKILFVLWAPDSAKIKPKMLYTSSKDGLRKKLVGIATEIQATDRAEIDHSAVLEKVLRK
eukprot:TRINITY_DN252_c0_g2_i2.p2 TRINITY_DN252_c0_g2~~TRINITY_DN252_c0_g2_i2.p2  ORF type:complete len:156 (+),score=36.57 TRINITY_DN252_c0_g2_i2:54-470(+)